MKTAPQVPAGLDGPLGEAACRGLRAMAHPVRLRLIEVLERSPGSVATLADEAGITPNQACGHLRLMQRHQLLEARRSGRLVIYSIARPSVLGVLNCIRQHCTPTQGTSL